ncbi:MAG: heavy-metal-associated domain-containing protein [bacterium]|nr:heavy-metal-associated domain-containing protein [bacterium]
MKYEFLIKTDCVSCLGIVKEFIKKIPGVKSAGLENIDSETGKVIIDYEGELNREELIKTIKEKTGYDVI